MKRPIIKTGWLALALALCLSSTAFSVEDPQAQLTPSRVASSGQALGPGVRLIRSDSESVILELVTPEYESEKLVLDGVTHDRLSVPSWPVSAEEGGALDKVLRSSGS